MNRYSDTIKRRYLFEWTVSVFIEQEDDYTDKYIREIKLLNDKEFNTLCGVMDDVEDLKITCLKMEE